MKADFKIIIETKGTQSEVELIGRCSEVDLVAMIMVVTEFISGEVRKPPLELLECVTRYFMQEVN